MTTSVTTRSTTTRSTTTRSATTRATAPPTPPSGTDATRSSAEHRADAAIPRPADDPARRDATMTLHRLAAMAALRDWVRRGSPVLMHEAVLAGTDPVAVASAARLTVAEAHLTWDTWASSRLADGEDLTLRDYLRVHTAFAHVLSDAP